jgi:uncharacterized membrane protein YgdD (TMEM256/DUF423 family)
MVELVATLALALGLLGIVVEFFEFFPARHGATGIMGAILFSGAIIALAIIEVSRARPRAHATSGPTESPWKSGGPPS